MPILSAFEKVDDTNLAKLASASGGQYLSPASWSYFAQNDTVSPPQIKALPDEKLDVISTFLNLNSPGENTNPQTSLAPCTAPVNLAKSQFSEPVPSNPPILKKEEGSIVPYLPNSACTIAPGCSIDDSGLHSDQWMVGPPLIKHRAAESSPPSHPTGGDRTCARRTLPTPQPSQSTAAHPTHQMVGWNPTAPVGAANPYQCIVMPAGARNQGPAPTADFGQFGYQNAWNNDLQEQSCQTAAYFHQGSMIQTQPPAITHALRCGRQPRERRPRGEPDVSESKDRRQRLINRPKHNHSKVATDLFKEWFYDNIANPFPSDEVKLDFANRTGLSYIQVMPPS